MTAIYARQSVDKKDSLSIEGQIELCMRECTDDSCAIFKDKGFSGKNTHRPAFEKMLAQVKDGLVQKVIVYRLDRFSRSIADFGRIWEVLQEHKVEFVSVNEKFDTSLPMGRAMLHIIMVFAQLERETIAERLKDNYQQRALRGEWTGGSAPFGFDIGRLTEESGKKSPMLVPNQDIETVKRIYSEYTLEGVSLSSLAKELTSESIPCMNRPAWDSVSISRILHNPVYVKAAREIFDYFTAQSIGKLPPPEDFRGDYACSWIGRRDSAKTRYTKPEEQQIVMLNHQGVISAGLWLECQQKLAQNHQIKNSGKGTHTWLTGLLKCACCGYGVKVNLYKQRRYLICTGRTNYRICTQKFLLSLDEIEHAVSQQIEELFSACSADQPTEAFCQIQAQLHAIDEKIGRLIGALADGSTVSIKYINQELRRLDFQKEPLQKQLLQPAKATPHRQFIGLNFNALGFEEKKLVCRQVIDRILLNGEHIEIIWKI